MVLVPLVVVPGLVVVEVPGVVVGEALFEIPGLKPPVVPVFTGLVVVPAAVGEVVEVPAVEGGVAEMPLTRLIPLPTEFAPVPVAAAFPVLFTLELPAVLFVVVPLAEVALPEMPP